MALLEEKSLYQKIAGAIRQEILSGSLSAGDHLPSVRQQCQQWGCTPGTIQRAYNQLAQEGLLVSQAGRGTRVAGSIPAARLQTQETLRRANLVHRSEAFLLEAITAGYWLEEIQQAVDLAMDRWRALNPLIPSRPPGILRFVGSHDPLLNELAHEYFGHKQPETALNLTYTGSMAGLVTLSQGQADLAGSHLWDPDSNSYNLPFVRWLLAGKNIWLVNLAHRVMGLMVAPGNPLNIQGLADLTHPGVRFVNRQSGSGTRVWLDAALTRESIYPSQVMGYMDERMTYSDVARAVAEGSADAGLGLEQAARAYGLEFIFLIRERYDLVMSAETALEPAVRQFIDWLGSEDGHTFVSRHAGYDSQNTGEVIKVFEG